VIQRAAEAADASGAEAGSTGAPTSPAVSATPTTTPPADPPEQHSSLEHLLLRFGLVTLDQLSAALREQAETGTSFADALVRDGVVSADDLARVADRTPAGAPQAPEPDAARPELAPAPAPTPVPEPEPEPEPAPEPPPLAAEAAPPAYQPPVALAPPPPVLVPEPTPAEPISLVPEPPPAPPALVVEPQFVEAPAPPPTPVVTGFVVRGRQLSGEEIEIASVDDAATAQRIARDAMRACARNDGSDWPVLNGRYVRPESIVSIEVAERA
jgi:hypothetical protein